MPSKLCSLCKNPVLKNQTIAVLSLPLRCTNDNGDYGIISEFFIQERLVHEECLDARFPSLKYLLYEDKDSSIVDELHDTLINLGEKISKREIALFIGDNKQIKEIPGLITLWFTKRNLFG